MSNTFGNLFRITTWGESHGDAIGVVIDGCPPLISLSEEDIQLDLDRRKPGQSEISTQRKEDDKVIIESGVFEGKTLGTPIHLVVRNNDMKSKDYNHMKDLFRPSHADYTYQAKYGIRNWKGGGRASARETIGRVAGGTHGGCKNVFLGTCAGASSDDGSATSSSHCNIAIGFKAGAQRITGKRNIFLGVYIETHIEQ